MIQENDTTNLVFKTKKTLLQNHMLINTANINNQEIANPGVYQAITRKRSKKEINDETILNRSRFRLSRKETHDEKVMGRNIINIKITLRIKKISSVHLITNTEGHAFLNDEEWALKMRKELGFVGGDNDEIKSFQSSNKNNLITGFFQR
ncbi:unnamed protein product [Rhizophagus irregularis]|nr:unnamed protein product [Rhizophagus irregularis]